MEKKGHLTDYDCKRIARELFRLQQALKAAQPVEEDWLAMNEAVAFTKLSKSALYHNKRIPRTKVGGVLRFPKSGLAAFMQSCGRAV